MKAKIGKVLFVAIVVLFLGMLAALLFENVGAAPEIVRLEMQVDSLQAEIQNVRSSIDTLGILSLNLKMENILLKNNIIAYKDSLRMYKEANSVFFGQVLVEYQAKLDSFIVELKK